MKFIRKSLIAKALTFFTLLMLGVTFAGIYFNRQQVESVSLNNFLLILIFLLVAILIVFVLDVFVPLSRVTRQVKKLLTGQNYRRLTPTTVDEIGVITHFFNEITRDLEKISYDIKERRRMSSELDIAARIQRDVLPKEAPEIPGLEIVAKTRAAAEIGGDCFDFLRSPDGTQAYIYTGDVTGHGVPSGLIMMMVDTLVRAMVSYGIKSSKDIVVRTNTLLTPKISTRLFMTMVMLRWDQALQKMFYTGAGHEHVLVYRAKTESVEAIRSGGIALGMIPDNSKIAEEKSIDLEAGDVILLYSDGITEAKNQLGEMYGLERLVNTLKRNGYRPSSENIFDNVTKDFANFVGPYIQIDDITMIVIKVLGKDSTAHKIQLSIGSDEVKTQSKIWDWNS